MLDTLLLLSGNDIPFPKARLTIHQPTLKEIGYIGEETFLIGCELLNFSKDLLSKEDQDNLQDKSDFEILMSIINDKQTPQIQRNRISAIMVLTILFPKYSFQYNNKDNKLVFFDAQQSNNEDNKPDIVGSITTENFSDFRDILVQMFALKSSVQEYNPQSLEARRIVDKLKEGHQKRAEQQVTNKKTNPVSVFSLYMSILAIGEQLSFDTLNQCTVYQLYDMFERYQLKINYDMYLQAKMAGAKNLKEVDNWMKNIHSGKE